MVLDSCRVRMPSSAMEKENNSRMGLRRYLVEYWLAFKMVIRSLTFNSFTSRSTVLDVAMEPVIWIVECITTYMGPIMVVMVVILTTGVVSVMYLIVLPEAIRRSSIEVCFHLVFGQWLLVNIVFHYYKCLTTSPGHPPQIVSETGAGGICKKCIGPKPLRTHHCSVCKTCVLKMDHHCPWINNCVGHYNHRYFQLFCIFMFVGTIYCAISVWPQFRSEFFNVRKTFQSFFAGSLFAQAVEKYVEERNEDPAAGNGTHSEAHQVIFYPMTFWESTTHKGVVYEFFICTGVAIALGALTIWHFRLISKGETSIEKLVNDSERKRLKEVNIVYKNPYDFGFKRNWKIFLGIDNHKRSFWRHVLLPSSHPPDEDGIHWVNHMTPGYVAKKAP